MAPFLGTDLAGLIPQEYSSTIIEEAVQQSAALMLGQRVPMGTSIAHMPVPKAFPVAAWTSGPGGRKAMTSFAMGEETLTAEEIAAVVALPDAWLEDASIPVWNWARPRMAEAIAVALDAAVLFGVDAPASFPAGGVAANAVDATVGIDAVDTVNNAMGAVEGQGLAVTGHAADLGVKSTFRGVRDANGALLLGVDQAGTQMQQTLYGLPVAYQSFNWSNPDYFTGAWQNLVIGVRSDIRYALTQEGVIADEAGKVLVSAFQDNVSIMKIWARFACVILNPVTRREPDGALPFAKAWLTDPGTGGATRSVNRGNAGPKADTGRGVLSDVPTKTETKPGNRA